MLAVGVVDHAVSIDIGPPEVERRFHRLTSEEIEYELKREADRDYGVNGKNWHTVFPGLMTWCWGRVVKS